MDEVKEKKHTVFTVKFMARTAIFAALSIILYCVPVLKFSVPFFPAFLEIHFDEVPILIASFAYGPISGLLIIILRTLCKLPLTTTACTGEICDLLYSIVFIIPASIVYKKMHSFKGAIISLLIGSVVQIVVASIFTTYVMLDVYSFFFHISKEDILAMTQKANSSVDALNWKFMLFISLPFNAMKDGIVIAITLLLYKRLHTLIDKIGEKKTRN